MIKRLIREYFGFNKKETNGFILLVPLIFLLAFLPVVLKKQMQDVTGSSNDKEATAMWRQEILASIKQKKGKKSGEVAKTPTLRPRLFDPNTINAEDMVDMGISPKIARTIENYRSKGGRFKIKSDFKKIYGLSEEMYLLLAPFVDLPDSVTRMRFHQDKPAPKGPNAPVARSDLNIATAGQLREIRGIGDVLSERIVSYRNYLGGFHSMEQLYEVYGLTETPIGKIKEFYAIPDSSELIKINLATATEEELRRHPYINHNLARILVAFHKQHKIGAVEDIRRIKVLSDSVYTKIAPYLNVSQ